MKTKKSSNGFTLVEIIVSVVLLGLIATALIPTFSYSYQQLRKSEAFTHDTFDYQQKIESEIEDKKQIPPTDPSTTKTIQVFGKNVTGHVIRVNDSSSSEVSVFITQNSIPNIVPEIVPPVNLVTYRGASVVSPVSPIDLLDSGLHLEVADPEITNATKPYFLMYVYRWYLSEEMDSTVEAPTKTKDYIALKEWNAAKKELSYVDSNQLSFIPNIENHYDYFETEEVKTAFSLSNSDWINAFGNRYIMYGVTPYSTSGRIGKEVLSNKVYINAPRITILSANVTADPKVVKVEFQESLDSVFDLTRFSINSTIGNLESVALDADNDKVIYLTFDADILINADVTENYISKGAVLSKENGAITIWGQGYPDGRFTIQPFIRIPLATISVTPKTLQMGIDETSTLSVSFTPSDSTDSIVWEVESGKEDIVTVDKGTVTALKEGIAKVYARNDEGTIFDYCTVTVTKDMILNVGFVKDALHSGNIINKLYIEFSGDISHINLTPQNSQQYVKVKIGGTEYHATEYDYVNGKSNAIVLYFNNISNINNATLNIKGNKIMIDGESVEVEGYTITQDVIGDVWYRIHGRHTEINEVDFPKFLRVNGSGYVGQNAWSESPLQSDVDPFLWAVVYSGNSNKPILGPPYEDSLYNLRNKTNNKYLETSNSNNTYENDGQIVRLTSNTNTNSQKFRLYATRIESAYYYKVYTDLAWTNQYNAYVFDLASSSLVDWDLSNTGDGKLIRWTDKNNQDDNQLFDFDPWIVFEP